VTVQTSTARRITPAPTGPPLVVPAASHADVRRAILNARALGLPLAVKATGHGTHVPLEGTVLVDTSPMATVLIDADRAVARVGAGAVWGDVAAAAAPFGLAPVAGSHPDVGVTGYTLGGGLSWLSRRYGLAADSLVRAHVVTAAGSRLVASEEQNSDLFWALRGGGGGFGVVTSLEFRLHPVTRVYAGTSYFGIERAAATLERYRKWIAGAPDALSTAILLTTREDGRRALAIRAKYDGDPAAAERLLRPLFEAAGAPLEEGMRSVPYAEAAMGGTPPRHVELLDDLPDAAIDAVVAAGAATVEIRHWGGAIGGPELGAGPVGARGARLSIIADARVPELVDALAPHATGGSFLNFLADTSRTETAFTPADLRRLRAVKRAYDPANLLRVGHTVQ
jgi:FAD/FMN-containing dehydrogenase